MCCDADDDALAGINVRTHVLIHRTFSIARKFKRGHARRNDAFPWLIAINFFYHQ